MKAHDYAVSVTWSGDTGGGYAAYARQFRAAAPGKAAVIGSADPSFRGDSQLLNPEEMLVMSLASCHMLSYLALCALKKIRVLAYADDATGRMVANHEGGAFEAVTLYPRVVIADARDLDAARALHAQAHASCYIASSVKFPVHHDATVVVGAAPMV